MKRLKVSIILNSIIVFLVTLGCILMFCGIKFMPSDLRLETSSIGMLKFFTVDSNILVGLTSAILIYYEVKLYKKKIKEIPNWVYILKMVSASSIFLTFTITLFFLAPSYGFYEMYNNNNLFFHLFVPILTIVSYVLYEKHNNSYKYAFLGMIPMVLYSFFYLGRVLAHIDDGGLTIKYDFYGFLQGNANNIILVLPIVYLVTYLLSLLVIFLNKKLAK